MAAPDTSPPRRADVAVGGVAVGVVFVAVLVTLADPGMAVDEALYRGQAKSYVYRLRQWGPQFVFHRQKVKRFFAHRLDHPPLGRLWLGLVHHLSDPYPDDLDFTNLWGLRLASALAFAGLAAIVFVLALRHGGRIPAVVATVSLVLLPRLFAHAHFATMEIPMCLGMVATVAGAGWAFARPGYGRAAVAGAVFGLALLVKMQAALLPVVVVPWALWTGRRKVAGPLAVWLVTGCAVFVAGWPLVWVDPIGNLLAYLGTGVQRAAIYLFYFGTKVADVDVPWHYPWVMLSLTTPVCLLAFSLVGLGRSVADRGRQPVWLLWLAAGLVLPVVFSIGGVPVYDGVRHFLPCVVFIALAAGLGAGWLVEAADRYLPRAVSRTGLAVLLMTQAYGTVTMHPYQLSYYNLLCGGLSGAKAMGMNVTYWGEVIDEPLLSTVAQHARPGDVIGVAPVLAPGVLAYYAVRRDFQRKGLSVTPYEEGECDWVIVFHRRAYIHWVKPLAALMANRKPMFTHGRGSVALASVYRVDKR